jgi:hypothetical protein
MPKNFWMYFELVHDYWILMHYCWTNYVAFLAHQLIVHQLITDLLLPFLSNLRLC